MIMPSTTMMCSYVLISVTSQIRNWDLPAGFFTLHSLEGVFFFSLLKEHPFGCKL